MTTTFHTPHVTGAPLTAEGMNAPLGELDSAIGLTRNGPGPLSINGGFTNPYDTSFWIAPANRANPTIASQSLWAQHRVSGNLGAVVHDAMATELRVSDGTNATYLNGFESTASITGGANTIPDIRAITANMTTSGSPSGTVTRAAMIVAQAVPALSGTIALTTVYGIYAEAQTVGGTNWNIYAPTGNSFFGQLFIGQSIASPADLRFCTSESLRWVFRKNTTAEAGSNAGSDLEILARDDTGGAIGTALTITRSNLAIKLGTGPLGFFGTTPVAKKTGWGAATGTATRTTFATSTVTTAQLAERVKALIDDLLAYGLISA